MAFIDIFKKKKKKERPSVASGEVKVSPQRKVKEKKEKKKIEEKPAEAKVAKEKKIDLAWKILKIPHVTEKATRLSEENQYVFKVWPEANKIQTKKAIEDIYGVDVVSVKVINVPRKKRKLGRTEGFRKGYKKAIIKIKEGQKIEIMPK